MIVDAHTHAYDRICGVTQYGVARSSGYGFIDLGSNHLHRLLPPSFVDSVSPCEVLIQYMDWVGVNRAVLLTQNIYGYTNDYLSDCVKKYPARFVALGSIDPLAKESERTLEYLLGSGGLKGLKLDLGAKMGLLALRPDFKLNDPRLGPIWEVLERHNATLAIDLGGSYGTPGHQLGELRSILETNPNLKLVICHLGFPPCLSDGGTGTEEQWYELLDLANSFQVWFDTAIFWLCTMLKTGREEHPYPTLKEYLRKCYDRIGPYKMMWGTDFPSILLWSTYEQNLGWIRNVMAHWQSEEKSAILWKNAAEAYGFKDIDENKVS